MNLSRIAVRFSERSRAMIDREAEIEGISTSAFIREAALARCGRADDPGCLGVSATDDCGPLAEAYISWLRDGLRVAQFEGGCELTTPFLDRHNDHLQIYAEKRNGAIILSDDGYILADLKASGMEIDTPKRREIFQSTLNGLGVKLHDDELRVEASEKTLGAKVHALVQGMLAVNDMYAQRLAQLDIYEGALDQRDTDRST